MSINKSRIKKSKKPSHGKYYSRDELIQNIHFYYHETDQCQAQVARTTGVSETTVANILRKVRPRIKT